MSTPEVTVGDIGEFDLIGRIAGIVGSLEEGLGIGDDAAVIPLGDGRVLLASTDTLVEAVHFRFKLQPPHIVGRRAMAVSVSDIAAMGGIPAYALVSLATPVDTPVYVVEELYRGLKHEADMWGVRVAGGNSTRTTGPLSIDVAMLGFAPTEHVAARSGAQPGDLLAVTGSLGGAAALRLASEAGVDDATIDPLLDLGVPTPRVREAHALVALVIPRAMLDLSDGLAGDVRHLCLASAVGACIYADKIPIRSSTISIATMLQLDPVTLALSGGEDYELLLALSPGDVIAAAAAISPTVLTVVGRCEIPAFGIQIERNGAVSPLIATGWEHF